MSSPLSVGLSLGARTRWRRADVLGALVGVACDVTGGTADAGANTGVARFLKDCFKIPKRLIKMIYYLIKGFLIIKSVPGQ